MAQRIDVQDAVAAVHQRDWLRRARPQRPTSLASGLYPRAHVPRCPTEDLDIIEPVRLAQICRESKSTHARFFYSE